MSDLSRGTTDLAAFKSELKFGRVLALDLGTKTIGLAVSDALHTIASPLETLKRTKFTKDAEALMQVVKHETIVALVLGLPLNMDGTEGPRAQSTRAFARNFAQHHELPLLLWDERLTTVAAERAMLDADLSRAKRAQSIDAVAAGLILQNVLDRLAQ